MLPEDIYVTVRQSDATNEAFYPDKNYEHAYPTLALEDVIRPSLRYTYAPLLP